MRVRSIWLNLAVLFGSSGKLRPFWASLAEKEDIPVLDFLFSVLEYDLSPGADGTINPHYTAALQRALAIKHCRVRTLRLAVSEDDSDVRLSDTFYSFVCFKKKCECLLVCPLLLEK